MLSRGEVFDKYRDHNEVSVLILGGGINGVALLRELSLQGVDALLVDKGDFASGASAACSRMVHGGLRYLEHGDIALVKEALLERNRLLANAPHAVKPIRTALPLFTYFTGIVNAFAGLVLTHYSPKQRGAFIVKLGLVLYDLFARKHQVMPKHRILSKVDTQRCYPLLNKKVKCLAHYYDGFVAHPERLAFELLQDAQSFFSKSIFINYANISSTSHPSELQLTDTLSNKSVCIKPKVVVNATGAWVDITNRQLNAQTTLIGGTKGSHIIVNHPELRHALSEDMFFYENIDQRICIMIPFGDLVLIGTTDLRVDNPDSVYCTDEEVDYLISATLILFPEVQLNASHVVSRFCGVRPLQKADSLLTGQISRDHTCHKLAPSQDRTYPVFSMFGGKWTTFRSFAELTANQILGYLQVPRVRESTNLRIGSGSLSMKEKQALVNELQAEFNLPKPRIEVIVQRYGRYSQGVLLFITAKDDALLPSFPKYSVRELQYIIHYEYVVSPIDLVARRTQIVLSGKLSYSLLIIIINMMEEAWGWTVEQKHLELQKALKVLQIKFGIFLQDEPS